jgi:predicted DNA-binding mobile mystery protein A
MESVKLSVQARRELDRKFTEASLSPIMTRPHSGWVRAIRSALGMSQAALAKRLGVAQSNIAQLERAELLSTVTLNRLAEVAAALDCTLVYALVPNSTLEDTVQRQARRIAIRQLNYTGTTMNLEDQGIEEDALDQFTADYTRELVAKGGLWNDP